MAKTREIKGRIKAVANIERITKTMQMIATARFQAMQRKATSAQSYTRKISEVVSELAAALAGEQVSSPLLSSPQPKAGRHLVLAITSNRGLCGGYNANVLRTAMDLIQQYPPDQTSVEVVGKKGAGFFQFVRRTVDAFHDDFDDSPTFEQVNRLAERYMQSFAQGNLDTVHVVSMAFKTMSRQEPVALQLLPLQLPTSPHSPAVTAVYEFSPDVQSLMDELLPKSVRTRLYQCFNEALVSEQLARMVAMKAATDAAGKMGKTLNRQYNRARQTAITTELSEIIGGAAALA